MNLDTLLAERAIYRALVMFARAMDARDWSGLDLLTTEDMTADLGTGPNSTGASPAVWRCWAGSAKEHQQP